MRRLLLAVAIAAALLLPSLTPVIARRAPSETSSPQLSLPSAAAGVSVTSSASSWANSSWVQLSASLAADIVVTGVAVNADADSENGVDYEIDLGTGAPSSESVIGTVAGNHSISGAETPAIWLKFPVPIDNAAAGSRLAIRLRTSGSSASAWGLAITYYAKPIGGSVVTTSAVSKAIPAAAAPLLVTCGGSAWASGPWATLTGAAGADWTVGAVAFHGPNDTGFSFELDIGTGGSGSEVVATTVKGGMTGVVNDQTINLWPVSATIGSGARVALRVRCSVTTAETFRAKLVYYDAAIDAGAKTANAQIVVPTGSAGTAVTAGLSFASGAWTQLIASTGSAIAITGLVTNNNSGATREFDVGVGAPGSEAVATTFLEYTNGSVRSAPVVPLPIAGTIGSGQRVAVRLRSTNNGESPAVALTYVNSSDVVQISADPQQTLSGTGGGLVSVTGSGSAFGNSGWGQLASSLAGDSLFTGIAYIVPFGLTNVDLEVDLGLGAPGSEAVLTTFRAHVGNRNGAMGTCYLPLAFPTFAAGGSRVAVRYRRSGTSTAAFRLGATYVAAAAAPPPVVGYPSVFIRRPRP